MIGAHVYGRDSADGLGLTDETNLAVGCGIVAGNSADVSDLLTRPILYVWGLWPILLT